MTRLKDSGGTMSNKSAPMDPAVSRPTSADDIGGKRARLERLKDALYPSQKRSALIALSLAALQTLGLDYSFDVETWKYLAQHPDLEDF